MAMTSPALIQAKLKPPTPRPRCISRRHLQARLAELPRRKAAVIRGAPGTGKSTLLALHLRQNPHLKARWVSLDAGDDDVRTFWSYVLEALKPDLGEQAAVWRALLDESLQAGDVDSVLVELVNGFQPEGDVFLILDDAHHLADARVVQSLQFFLRWSSERVHVVLLTREEPALPLSEWRMAGQLLEIDNDDLKVSREEARNFLNDTLGMAFSEGAAERLTTLAEGWLGGLQLLAVAAEQAEDPVRSIEEMGRPVVDYLSEQILQRLPEDEQRFLVDTSILSYLHEGPCRAVTGDGAAGEALLDLLAKNLFIVPVDEGAGLYRYHHLFGEFLRQRFRRLPMGERRELHLRAARHYRDIIKSHLRGDAVDEAVRHFLHANEPEEALDVIGSLPGGVRSWRLLQKVPLAALHSRPDFIYQRLFSLLAEQRLEEAGEVVRSFRGAMGDDTANALFDMFGALLGLGPMAHAAGELTAERLQRQPLGEETKAVLYSLLAAVFMLWGREQEALTCLAEAERIAPRVENPYIRYYSLQFKAQLKEHMGDLAECEGIYTDMFRLVERHRFLGPVKLNADMGFAGVLLKGGRLGEARIYLDRIRPRAVQRGAPTAEHGDGAAAMSGAPPTVEVQAAYWYNELEYSLLAGDGEAAADAAARLTALNVLGNDIYRAPMLRYLLLLDMASDADVARFRFDDIADPTWQDCAVQSQLLVRDGRFDEALALLDESLSGLRRRQARLPLVDTLLLKAELLLKAGNGGMLPHPARDALREAVHYAAGSGLVAPFILSAGAVGPALPFLRREPEAEWRAGEAAFLDDLIARLDEHPRSGRRDAEGGERPAPFVPDNPLSERETEVLHVLAEGATNKEIAERLFISVATVKTHVVNVYSKLGVSNRIEAVAEARRRGIVP